MKSYTCTKKSTIHDILIFWKHAREENVILTETQCPPSFALCEANQSNVFCSQQCFAYIDWLGWERKGNLMSAFSVHLISDSIIITAGTAPSFYNILFQVCYAQDCRL